MDFISPEQGDFEPGISDCLPIDEIPRNTKPSIGFKNFQNDNATEKYSILQRIRSIKKKLGTNLQNLSEYLWKRVSYENCETIDRKFSQNIEKIDLLPNFLEEGVLQFYHESKSKDIPLILYSHWMVSNDNESSDIEENYRQLMNRIYTIYHLNPWLTGKLVKISAVGSFKDFADVHLLKKKRKRHLQSGKLHLEFQKDQQSNLFDKFIVEQVDSNFFHCNLNEQLQIIMNGKRLAGISEHSADVSNVKLSKIIIVRDHKHMSETNNIAILLQVNRVLADTYTLANLYYMVSCTTYPWALRVDRILQVGGNYLPVKSMKPIRSTNNSKKKIWLYKINGTSNVLDIKDLISKIMNRELKLEIDLRNNSQIIPHYSAGNYTIPGNLINFTQYQSKPVKIQGFKLIHSIPICVPRNSNYYDEKFYQVFKIDNQEMAILICSKQFDCRMLEKLNYLKSIAEFEFEDKIDDDSELCILDLEFGGAESGTSKSQSDNASESVPVRISKVTGRRMSKFLD